MSRFQRRTNSNSTPPTTPPSMAMVCAGITNNTPLTLSYNNTYTRTTFTVPGKSQNLTSRGLLPSSTYRHDELAFPNNNNPPTAAAAATPALEITLQGLPKFSITSDGKSFKIVSKSPRGSDTTQYLYMPESPTNAGDSNICTKDDGCEVTTPKSNSTSTTTSPATRKMVRFVLHVNKFWYQRDPKTGKNEYRIGIWVSAYNIKWKDSVRTILSSTAQEVVAGSVFNAYAATVPLILPISFKS
ncbi:hypothetical protein AA313_de0207198 [Arthrobotrys entomopaga]|nr:hypothetical protein AA313_de0207198 [Arthrobotrys entomopaga]